MLDNLFGGMGSSPHARGARHLGPAEALAYGIIPACAGSTLERLLRRHSKRDHPRMRGEHALIAGLRPCLIGSSPHARGAPLKSCEIVRVAGIIPACAGSTVPALTPPNQS